MITTCDRLTMVWTLVHGETPIASWKDEALGDSLRVDLFERDFMNALSGAHWLGL